MHFYKEITLVSGLVQAGWDIEFIFALSVRAINGIYNRSRVPLLAHEPDPDFQVLLNTLKRIQASEAVGMRIKKMEDGEAAVLFFHARSNPQVEEDIRFVREKLGLNPDANEFKLVFGSVQASDLEITILSRSIFEMMLEIASGINVPPQHLIEQWTFKASDSATTVQPIIRIDSAPDKPENTFVAVRYNGHWFWIDKSDFRSKRAFTFMMILLTLAEGRETTRVAPVLTIPAGP